MAMMQATQATNGIEEAIVKVYLLQRETLRAKLFHTMEHAPELAVPPIWVLPMDVPAIDNVLGRAKPFLYYDRERDRFTHIVHAFAVTGRPSDTKDIFPVQRVITIPEKYG